VNGPLNFLDSAINGFIDSRRPSVSIIARRVRCCELRAARPGKLYGLVRRHAVPILTRFFGNPVELNPAQPDDKLRQTTNNGRCPFFFHAISRVCPDDVFLRGSLQANEQSPPVGGCEAEVHLYIAFRQYLTSSSRNELDDLPVRRQALQHA